MFKKFLEEKMDKVNPKAVKKKFDDREDKDIDNDGDVDSSDEYLHKRRKAISKALTKEEVKLDEAPRRKGAPKIKPDFLKVQRAKDAEHNAAMGRTKTGRKKPVRAMSSTQRSLASMRKEEVELDEVSNAVKDQLANIDLSIRDWEKRWKNKSTNNPNDMKAPQKIKDLKAQKAALMKKHNIKEEVELDESVTKLSNSRLKYHATKGFPHGSFTNAEIEDEHKRRMKTEPNYHKAKPSLSEEVNLGEAVNVKGIKKAVDDGKSMDAIVGMFANKRTTNTDDIRKVVKDYMWNKRMKKESLGEAKDDYTIYHKSFSSAVQHALSQVEKKGYTVDEEEWGRKVAMGPRKPGKGKTNSYTIDLMKGDKETKRKLQMQVYYDEGRYELNMYIS